MPSPLEATYGLERGSSTLTTRPSDSTCSKNSWLSLAGLHCRKECRRFAGRRRECLKIKEAGIPVEKSTALVNLYAGQLKKIRKEIMAMHEDLQYDYLKELEKLS